MTRLRLVLDCREPLGRGGYFFAGILLCALKYNIDRFLMWQISGQRWSLLDYTRVGEYLWPRFPAFNDIGSFVTMLGFSLPFMGLGIVLTLKRLRSVPLPPWLALIFFLPVIKFIFFALLCLLPSHDEHVSERVVANGPKGWFGITATRICIL